MYLYFVDKGSNFQGKIDTGPTSSVSCSGYDIIQSHKNSELEKIATHVVNMDSRTFDKCDYSETQEIRTCVESILNNSMNELILG